MLANSLSMANRLLPIQYTPRAAGRVKQIHRENRGMMIMVILADWSMVDFLVCKDVGVDVVGDDHRHHQPQTEGLAHALLLPEQEVGRLRQVHPQEGKVDEGHVRQLRDGRDDLVVAQEDILGHLQLPVE